MPMSSFTGRHRCHTVERQVVWRSRAQLGSTLGTHYNRLRPSDGWILASWLPTAKRS
jgi:hypothetical protein